MACMRFAKLRSKSRVPERPNDVSKPTLEKPDANSFSSIMPFNASLDSSRPDLLESHTEDDKETQIDLEAAIRAVNVALTGLEIGGKRQSPPPPRPETAPVGQSSRTRPGFPPKAAFPRAFRRIVKFVNPQQRQLSDSLAMQQQGMQLPYQRPGSSDFLMNSGDLLNAQLNGYFPNGLEMRSNYSESDMQNALWATQSGDNWNIQLQHLIQQQGLPNGMTRHLSADFSGNPQYHKNVRESQYAEFLMNSSDSWSSKIEVPKGSGRGDSFSSKIEFPVNCDSFSSKMSASVREDSFSSQPYWNRNMEHHPDVLMDTAFSIPESIVQELECMAEGDVSKEFENRSDTQDPHAKSEQDILLAITGTLKRALEGSLGQEDLASDLNYLTIAVRRHLMDFQTFSSGAAEKFLLVGSTVPVVCCAAMFSDHVVSLLKRFMDIIASGHRMLTNASVLVTRADNIDRHTQIEAMHMLTNMYNSIVGSSDGTTGLQQQSTYASFDSTDFLEAPRRSSNSDGMMTESLKPSPELCDSNHKEPVFRSA